MKILIVDDSNFSQKVTASLLKSNLSNVDLYFATNGEEGFASYKEYHPDFVFADLLMPKVSGQEMIQLIKEYDENANIIVLSADVQKSIKEEVGASIISFINKPFDQEKASEICARIKGEE